jgi:hypothetical protein
MFWGRGRRIVTVAVAVAVSVAVAVRMRARREPLEEMFKQQRDIVAAGAQRRDTEVNDVDPIEQILAEEALSHHLGEIAIGGRDDPHIHALVDAIGADLLYFARFEETQEQALHPRRHLADLVEQNGSLVGCFELAGPVAVGAGEASLQIAEQLRLEERFRQARTIHRDERAITAGALLMDRARHELLARAAFARDQYFRVGVGNPRDFFLEFAECSTLPDEGRGRFVPHDRLLA